MEKPGVQDLGKQVKETDRRDTNSKSLSYRRRGQLKKGLKAKCKEYSVIIEAYSQKESANKEVKAELQELFEKAKEEFFALEMED